METIIFGLVVFRKINALNITLHSYGMLVKHCGTYEYMYVCTVLDVPDS